MATTRYTEFPTLSDCKNLESDVGQDEKSIEIAGEPSLYLLKVSWALLLRSYTEEKTPIFKFNGRSVAVDLQEWDTSSVQDIAGVQGSSYTGISTLEESSSDGFDLLLRYTKNHPFARLCFSKRVSLEQRPHVADQLQWMIQELSNLQTLHFSWRMMTPDQLSIVNNPPSKIRGPELLHQLVQESAKHHDASALEFQPATGARQRFSYAQMHNLSDELADYVRSLLDVQSLSTNSKQEIIPILIPQSSELYLSVLAVLKAGAAFCPLRLDAPQERIKFIVNDTAARVVMTTSLLKKKLKWEGGPRLIAVDSVLKGLGIDCDEVRVPQLQTCEPSDLAYVMYTSGSTGLPKAVGVSHLASTQSLLAHQEHIPEFNRFLQFAAPTFDVFVFELFFPLYRGRTVVGCDRNELLVNLPAMINHLEIDAAELTPTVVGTLLRKRSQVPSLKLLLTIGEMLTPPVIDEFGSSSSRAGILHGLYGPTEAAVHCTSASSFSSDFKPGIIGMPLDTVSCFITAINDPETPKPPNLEVLPKGHVGELVIGGMQLAVGYLNRPEQTSLAFVDTEAYGRLYKTGDKARLLPNGVLECLGRIDKAQVKLRGQRVELGEIEQVAYQIKGIESATAILINGTVILFCVSDTNQITPKDLAEACRRWLPGFMVPADIVLLADVPRTPSGKIDRTELQGLYESQNTTVSLVIQDRLDNLDKLVQNSVQELLNSDVDIQTNLAAAGLDSLKAIGLASKLRRANFEIGAVDILKDNTIHGIAELLRGSAKTVPLVEFVETESTWFNVRQNALDALESLIPVYKTKTIADIIPCTPLQTAMLAETLADSQAYCNWIELKCPSSIDFTTIRAALMLLALRNEILRTGFAQVADSSHPFVQVIWDAMSESDIVQASVLEKDFRINTIDALLRPWKVQVQSSDVQNSILIQIHHALYDGWAWEHIVNDFDSILQNQEIGSRPQFRDLVKFYRDPTTLARSASAKEYWQNMLEGATPCIFPNLQGKSDVRSCLRVTSMKLSTKITEVEWTSNRLGVSPQAVIQAVYAWLLGVYVADSHISFGTVSSGRTIPLAGIEDIIGPCISTFPVRLDVSHSRTVQDLILAVHNLSRNMLDHQEVSLHEIKKICGFRTNQVLFDTVFIWQQTLRDRTPKLLVQSDGAEYLEFDLTIEIEPLENCFHVKANYQNAKLPENQMKTFLHQMDQLIAQFARNPSTPLVELGRFLTDGVLSIENPTPEQHHGNSTLCHSVEAFAEKDPTRIALEFFEDIEGPDVKLERVSYLGLNRKANQVAHYLLKQGLSEDELIGICLEKSVDLYVGILGIIKAGAGYLPLTPQTPANRRNHILTDSRVRYCISHSILVDVEGTSDGEMKGDEFTLNLGNKKTFLERPNGTWFPPSVTVLCMDRIDLQSMPINNPYRDHQLSNLAYAVFTSGTTGTPKGVLVTQANMVSNLAMLSKLYPVSRHSRLLQACSQAFDVSVFEIFFAWFTGVCLCSATHNVLFRDFEKSIRAMEITHLSLTPTVAALVRPENVPRVEFLVTAGEALTEKVFNMWKDKGLFQGYGPSETTNICTVRPFVTASDNINNLGPPLRNTSAFAMQGPDSIDIVPRGGIGEFCFGGDQVFRGYLNMSAITNQKIIHHPKFGRLYRSGDYGRILSDGSLEFYGRQDDQVKIRGQRVELGEINNLLLRSTKVIDVATLIDPRGASPQQLLTFWVPENYSSVDWQILDDHDPSQLLQELFLNLVRSLPTYMVPSLLIPIPYIPMTVQGKIDKRRLVIASSSLTHEQLKHFSQLTKEESDSDAWSWTERTVSQILSNTIGCTLQQAGRHVSFFSLGLDSISAISFSRSLREQGFPSADVSMVLRHSSISKLSDKLAHGPEVASIDYYGIRRLDGYFNPSEVENITRKFDNYRILKILPCTPLQEVMLSSSSASDGVPYYNHTVFEIHGDIDRLYRAWQEMASRHDILRTCIIPTENERYLFAQVILSSHEIEWTSIKLEIDDFDTALTRSMNNAVRDATEHKPKYSFTVLATAIKTVLLLSIHHSLYDGEAFQLLLNEVKETYDGCSLPAPVSSEPFLSTVHSLNLEEADKFWNKNLQNFQPRTFSAAFLGLNTPSQGQLRSVVTTQSSLSNLSSFTGYCKKFQISMLSLLQASWAKVLSLFLHTTDVCFGNVVSGRTLPLDGIEVIMAPCFNTIPIRLRLGTDMSNLDLIKTAKQLNLDLSPYQFTPLRRIHRLKRSRDLRLFETLFILQKPQQSLDNHIWSVKKDIGAMDFPIVCEVVPMSEEDTLQFNIYTYSYVGGKHSGKRVVLTSSRTAKVHGHAEILLNSLTKILEDCLKYPSAIALDFRFLGREFETMLKTSAANIVDDDGLQTSSSCQESSVSDFGLSAEWTVMQRDIFDIVAKLSKQSPVKIEQQTSFFRLGLDSINAAQIAANLRQKGWMVNPIEVIEYPSISELSSYLETKTPIPRSKPQSFIDFSSFDCKLRPDICLRHSIDSADLESIRPCTAVQSGMLASFLTSNGSTYFNSFEMQIPKTNQIRERLLHAWSVVASRYEMLRTGFTNIDDTQHPFAMLTYKPGVFDIEIEIKGPLSQEGDSLGAQTQGISKVVLRSLHRPPWRVQLTTHGEKSFGLRVYIHHALYDAHSIMLILRDVRKCYYGEKLSATTAIDFLLKSIISEYDNDIENKKIFWQNSVGESAVGVFPNTSPVRVRSPRTYTLERYCRTPLSEIQAKCRNVGVTIQAAGQAAWARVLSSYVGEISIIFGTVYSGRASFEGGDVVAFPSVVTVPVSAQLDKSNLDLLRSFMRAQPNLLKHQFTPLRNIQRWTGRGDEPLIHSIFVYQSIDDRLSYGGISWDIVEETSTADYPVSIEMISQSQETGIKLRVVFRDDILPPEQASLLLEQLEFALSDTLSYPRNRCSDVSLFPESLLSIVPSKEAHIQSPVTTLHQFVEMQALQIPHRIALEFITDYTEDGSNKTCWTYRQLDEEGTKIAQLLVGMGIRSGSLIAVCFKKCPQAYFATLGILKAGCAFVAIDPEAPIERQKFIIKDSNSSLVLAMTDTAEALHEQNVAAVICLDDVADVLGNATSVLLQPPEILQSLRGNDLCYCLYTSGTTGTPKACLITHENVVQFLMSFQQILRWDSDSRFLQFASFHFDVSILEQYWSWSVGICVTSAPRDLILEDIGGAIRALGITHIDLTPSLAKTLHPDDAPSLCRGVFITGGEKLQQEVLDNWGSKRCIYNAYGPTETTIGNTMFPRVPPDGKPSNIGRQFDNVASYVFRVNTTSAVLRGAVGELCIAGKLVGRGYLNKPELTEMKFPFLQDRQERVYRTGDLVRILHDNTFEYLGRTDDQVKLRGQRLEVAEINEVLKRGIDEVRDVATMVIEHKNSQRMHLVSFLVPCLSITRNAAVEILKSDALHKITLLAKEICQGNLPPYMVPTHFIPISHMPLSSNNKIELKSLKSLYLGLSSKDLLNLTGAKEEFRTTWDEKELIIVSILARAVDLNIASISKHSNILRLGLDSISVINFAHSLKNAGFPGAQVSRVMQVPIVGQLCNVLTKPLSKQNSEASARLLAKQNIQAFQSRHFTTVCNLLKMQPDGVEAVAPCTPLQQGIISRSLNNGAGLYFEEFCYQLSATTDLTKLRNSWVNVIASRDVLRLRFCPTIDGHAQVVCKIQNIPWFEKGFETEEELEACRYETFSDWCHANSELNDRLFEICVFYTPVKTLLYLRIFHALYDGMSLPMILQDVVLGYAQVSNIKPRPSFIEALPAGPLCEVEGARDFWSRRFMKFPYQSKLSSRGSRFAATTFATLDVSHLKLDEARRRHNTTHQSLIQAAWVLVLRRFFPSEIGFGMVVAGRSIDYDGIDRVIGPLFNTIPFHIDIENIKSWDDVVGSCHDFNTAAIPYQHSSLRNIMRWCQRLPTQSLFETLFVFQREAISNPSTADPLWKQMDTTPQADYPLSFEAVLSKDENSLQLRIVAQDVISSTDKSMQMLQDVGLALTEITSNSAISFLDFRISKHELKPVISGYHNPEHNDTATVSNSETDFRWSVTACSIRDEIALLSGIEPTDIDAHTSIFALGLDSIDAIKLSSRLKRRGLNLSVSIIMQNVTILQLAQASKDSRPEVGESPKLLLDTYEGHLSAYLQKNGFSMEKVEAVFPPTPFQEAVFADTSATSFSRYLNQEIFVVGSSVDIRKLELAWKSVIDQSPILRTSCVAVDDPDIPFSYAQVVHRPGSSSIRHVSMTTNDNIDAFIKAVVKHDRVMALDKTPFGLTFIEHQDRYHMVLTLSHALYDGVSLSLLHNDIFEAYHDRFSSRPSYRETLEHILGSSDARASQYWIEYISGAKPSSFLPQVQTPLSQPQINRIERCSLVSATEVRSFVKSQGISIQALGQLCWALLLGYYLKTLEVTFGVILSGRDTEQSNEVMLPTMNTVVVRSVIGGSLRQMLHDMQWNCANAVQYQHFPLRKTLAAVKNKDQKLFDSLFLIQRKFTVIPNDERLYESTDTKSSVEFPVCVEMELNDDSLSWKSACEDVIFDTGGLDDLVENLDLVLRHIMQSPNESAIELTEGGIVICGLPAFRENKSEEVRNRSIVNDWIDPSKHEGEWTLTESTIRKVLSEVSHIPEGEITKLHTIFNLGLDSIIAIKVSSLLGKRSIRLGVGEMLKAATIMNMAELADAKRKNSVVAQNDLGNPIVHILSYVDVEKALKSSGIDLEQVQKVLPCSPGQVYMLSAWENSEGAEFYSTFQFRALKGLDKMRLSHAWYLLCEKSPILRTRFASTGNRQIPFLQVALRKNINPVVWLSQPPLDGQLNADVTKPLVTLAVAMPALYSLTNSRRPNLFLKIHHALYDGVSLNILVQQLQSLYHDPKAILQSESQFEDFLSQELMSSSQTIRKDFWSRYLGRSDNILLPLTGPLPKYSRNGRNCLYTPHFIQSTTGLSMVARAENISFQALFLASYAVIYAQLLLRLGTSITEKSDIVFGIYLANRSHQLPGLPALAAPTLNLVPLRIHEALRAPVLEIAKNIQRDLHLISNVENSRVGLWEIYDWTGVQIDCFVNFLTLPDSKANQEEDETEGLRLGLEHVAIDPGSREYVAQKEADQTWFQKNFAWSRENAVKGCYRKSIDIEAAVRNNALDVGIYYPCALKGHELAGWMMQELKQILENIYSVSEKI